MNRFSCVSSGVAEFNKYYVYKSDESVYKLYETHFIQIWKEVCVMVGDLEITQDMRIEE